MLLVRNPVDAIPAHLLVERRIDGNAIPSLRQPSRVRGHEIGEKSIRLLSFSASLPLESSASLDDGSLHVTLGDRLRRFRPKGILLSSRTLGNSSLSFLPYNSPPHQRFTSEEHVLR